MAYYYRAQTPKYEVFRKSPPTLEEAQTFVGGYVEVVGLPGGSQLLVNADGRLAGLPVNERASTVHGGAVDIVGNVMCLCGKARWR